ncbi:gamma-glutamylaminecyclotransferase [Trichonephila clavata]|uniref:Gamma-glutamylaminecyclotransferase n=1 Tax=Trichonephila clavata TaxID=2740835 RepID=A0A8X6LQ42_TRICU|nr:gamma-glutamylaminecyclotransferase [Trichonephila clavata]
MFVYGTLKRNEPNYDLVADPSKGKALFEGMARTVQKYPLVIASRYNIPFLLYREGVGKNVIGELYKVDEAMLVVMDELECNGRYYQRIQIEVQPFGPEGNKGSPVKPWVYFLLNFREHLLELPHLEDYSSKGPHGLEYVSRKQHVLIGHIVVSPGLQLSGGSIPEVIANLSLAEQRLISRIIPFVKIIKLSGVFGQYSFRGQAVLFVLDVFEITENLSNMLPRTSNNAGIVVVTERLENINVTRKFSISRQKVYYALYWLVANNPLYKDVTIDPNVVINEEDIIRAEEAPAEMAEESNGEATVDTSAYMRSNDFSRIVRASWHQANDSIFISGFAGVQCCAMVLVNILRAYILSPQHWSTNDLNLNMISSDHIYRDVRFQTKRNFVAYPIDENGYLLVQNFNVLKNDLVAFNKRFQINFDEEPRIYGDLNDQVNQANFGRTLCQGIDKIQSIHKVFVKVFIMQVY